jgi:hypothetical protein
MSTHNLPKKERIQLNMSTKDMLITLGEGNPGALTVLVNMLSRNEEIDPQAALGAINGALQLDAYGIYGSDIWILFKDICKQSMVHMLAVLRAVQMGQLSERTLLTAVKAAGEGQPFQIDLDQVLTRLQQSLPLFGRAAAATKTS